MPSNQIVTARGQVLNFEELIRNSKRPLKSNVDMKDKIEKQKMPPKQLNVRGFVPSTADVARPVQMIMPDIVDDDGPSMADLTGITIDRSKYNTNRPENPIQEAHETLHEILT